MAHFDRFDVCDAYYALKADWNISGVLPGLRDGTQAAARLQRMGYSPSLSVRELGRDGLSDNAREIYDAYVSRMGWDSDDDPDDDPDADGWPHVETRADYARFLRAHESGLRGLSHVSAGACPGCEDCGLPRRSDDEGAPDDAPLIFRDCVVASASVIPEWCRDDPALAARNASPLPVIGNGCTDSLYLYGAEFGPSYLVREDSYEDALEAVYDALAPIDAGEIGEAFGLYWLRTSEACYLCGDYETAWDAGTPKYFPEFNATHRVISTHSPSTSFADVAHDWLADHPNASIVEGYAFQASATGTGIVAPSPHEWLIECTRPACREHGVRIELEAREDAGREEFTWSDCEVCGRGLEGAREPVHGVDADGEIIHLSACEDCAYFVAYGRLDDETMLRVGPVGA